jgi:predicted dithiol-disulfide oxidoreductase (DUF899 family)
MKKATPPRATPPIVDRETWNAQIAALRVREKAHTREGDAITAARRRLPMVEVDPSTLVIGKTGAISLLDTFEGRSQLFASYHMWHTGLPAAKQCEGCTFNSGQVWELSYLHARDVTYAVFCEGPYEESNRYREFMGWEMPWYSVPEGSAGRLIAGRHFGMKVCYLRDGGRVFETYWTTARGCEVMNGSFGMLDMTVYGRREHWEDSPEGWPVIYGPHSNPYRLMEDGSAPPSGKAGRPTPQWSRLAAGHSDDLGSTGEAPPDEHCCH